MIKNLRYLCTLLLIAVASVAWGEEVTFSYSDFTGGTQSTGSPISTSNDYVTFAESKGYANTSFVNLYASGVITITPKSGYKVTNVVITASATNYNGYQSGGTITASEGTVSGEGTTITWIGESTEGFTLSHNKQIRMTKVTITYLSTSSNPAVSTPTFTPTAGVYTSAQSVAISCETEGATIYYTTDGSTPNNESNEYTSAIKVSTTMTIKAIAVKSNMENSVVASATYAILAHNGSESDPYTVADARTAIDANNGVENVYATGIVSKIVTAYNSSYGNITFDISVDGEESSDQLRVYRCKNSDAGEPDVAAIQKGDVVVVYGNLTKFGTTYEFGEDCQLISRTSSSSQVAAGISFSDTSAEADLADLSSFTAPTFSNPNNLTVAFTSSNEEVATVSADGTVSILAEGTTKIIATSKETEQYLAGEASYTLRVINSNKVLVTVDADGNTIFDLSDNAWKFPTGKQVDEGSFTNNGYTIKVAGTTGNGYYFYAGGNALLFGKSGAYLTLPAFGYDVHKIDVVGSSGASEVVKQNIFVGETAVSTETTGAKDVTNTYDIAEEYQAAGNVYTLKVTSAHNTQVTKIIVYKAVVDNREDAGIAFDPSTLTITQGETGTVQFQNPNNISESEITFASDNEAVADWDDSGLVFGTATGTATITATFEGNETYKPATATLVVTVKENLNFVEVVKGCGIYQKITSADELEAGKRYLIVGYKASETAYYAYNGFDKEDTSKKYGLAVDVIVENDRIDNSESVATPVVLQKYGDNWFIMDGDNFLAYNLPVGTTKNNNLFSVSDAFADGTIADGIIWNIDFESESGYLINNVFNTERSLEFNSDRFACYKGSEQDVVLYKELGELSAYAVVVKNEEEKPVSVTFYYDDQKANRGGENISIVDIIDGTQNECSAWNGTPTANNTTMTKATFDASFADFHGLKSLQSWFIHCIALEEIVGLDKLNTEEVTTMNAMFYNCRVIEKLDVSKFNTENVTNMHYMFGDCRNLKDLDVSNFNMTNASDISGMFYWCNSLPIANIGISYFNTVNVTNFTQLFNGCQQLEEIDLSNFDTRKATHMGAMFGSCKILKSIKFGENFKTDNVINMEAMFQSCYALQTLDLTGFNTSSVRIMNSMFNGCKALTTIYVGDGWNTKNVTSSENMFNACTNLVGGAGTAYDVNADLDKTRAILDGGVAAPGYLTYKTAPSAPTFNPVGGEYSEAQTVAISAAEGTKIYYTTDGSQPSAQNADQVYTEPVTISQTATLKAIAVKGAISEATSAEYKITATTLPGDVNGDKKVDIADVTALVNIIVNSIEPTDAQIAAGNLNPDDGLTVNDVEALVQMILSNSNQ